MTDELVARLMARLRERMCACGHNGLDHYTPDLKKLTYDHEPLTECATVAMGQCRRSDCGCKQMQKELCAGPELDRLVALRVMGHVNVCSCLGLSDFTNDECNTCGGAFVEEYSTDIAAAWEVLKEFGTGRAIRISSTVGGGWRISFSDTVWENRGAEWDEHAAFYVLECVVPNAEDLPLAICRAALKAVRK